MDPIVVIILICIPLFALMLVCEVVRKRRGRQRVQAWDSGEWGRRQWEFLVSLYRLSSGSPRYGVKTYQLRRLLGWEWEAVESVRDTLESAQLLKVEHRPLRVTLENLGLVQAQAPKRTDATSERLHITALGAEQVRTDAGPAAIQRLAGTVVHVSGRGHQVMVDSPRGRQVARSVIDRAAVVQALTEFRNALEAQASFVAAPADARRYLSLAEVEAGAEVPDEALLHALMRRMGDIATSAGGSALWQAAAVAIGRLVG